MKKFFSPKTIGLTAAIAITAYSMYGVDNVLQCFGCYLAGVVTTAIAAWLDKED